eukprot:5366429-Heterocapsa_arctica.AAC.1
MRTMRWTRCYKPPRVLHDDCGPEDLGQRNAAGNVHNSLAGQRRENHTRDSVATHVAAPAG